MRLLVSLLVLFCSSVAVAEKVTLPHQDGYSPPIQLEQPIRVTIPTIDERAPIKGEITAWAFGAFWIQSNGEGESTRIGWDEIKAHSVYQTTRRMLDRDDLVGYFRLGVELLVLDEEEQAELAFRHAVRLNERAKLNVETAKALHQAGEIPQWSIYNVIRNFGDQDSLLDGDDPTLLPYQRPKTKRRRSESSLKWTPTKPWVVIDTESQEQALTRQREFVKEASEQPGVNELRTYESDHFIVVTELNERAMLRWSFHLEAANQAMSKMFSYTTPEVYSGKCMVFVFETRRAFVEFEQRMMGFDASRIKGVCHRRGSEVILSFFHEGNDADFQYMLIHESVHGFVHRYLTPRSLPAWANEGLADCIASRLTKASRKPLENWKQAKNYAMRGDDPLEILGLSYEAGSWPSADSFSVSHMFVRFLLNEHKKEFMWWIQHVKNGADWEIALQEKIGSSKETLAAEYSEAIKAERSYKRAR